MMQRRTRLLAGTFFDRLFENDLFSSSISASNGVLWLVAALATPGVMFSGSQYYFYAHARTFRPEIQDRILFLSQVFHIDFAMAIAGIVTMLVWTSLTPDRRDALVLGPLPLQAGEQARARLLALFRFFVLFAVAVSVPTAIAFTFVTMGESSVGELAASIAGHSTAAMLGAGFVFFLLVDLQLLLAATMGPRGVALVTWPLQALALVALIGALSYTARVADAMLASQALLDSSVLWNPAAWFIGVYRWIAGDPREIFALLAMRGALGSAIVVMIALAVYPLAYRRCIEKVIAGEGSRAGWWTGALSRVWLAGLRPFLHTPLERGLAAFIIAMFTRSHTHRFVIGSYLGLGVFLALPLVGRLIEPRDDASAQFAWFSVPLGLLCWATASLRVAMMLPVEPAANWLFKLTEPVDKRRVLSTAVTVILAATAVPLAVGFGAGAVLSLGVVLGATLFAVVLTCGVALVELLTLTMTTVPGTCTYRPGQLRLRVLWPVYLLAWTSVAYVLPRLVVAAVGDAIRTTALIAALVVVAAALRMWRVSRARQLRAFVYEEREAAVTTTLDLNSARA